MDKIFFEVNDITCGYNGTLVFRTNRGRDDEIIGSFENILLKKITPNYAIFYLSDIDKYIKFDGEEFYENFINTEDKNFNNFDFEIIKHDREDSYLDIITEEVRFTIDGVDLINNVGRKDDFHWGINIYDLLEQKANFYGGKILIGLCGCTCEGCDDIIATIATYDNVVYWDVHHEVGGGPIKAKHEYFVFEKTEYENAFKMIENYKNEE